MDARIEMIFQEEMKGDNSFKEKENFLSLFFGGIKYSQTEMKETWNMGIRHGIEIGLNRAGLAGQRLELHRNVKDPMQKEFLEKFYKLADEYKCAIQYHPQHGMVIVDTDAWRKI